MLIGDIANSGPLPALQALMSFASQRHPLIASNIANIDTPNYTPTDVSVSGFQKVLREAIDERRERTNDGQEALNLRQTREISADGNGGLILRPSTKGKNILFHDGNNRDLERTMQDLVENAATFKTAAELFRGRMDLLRSAMAERV